MRIITWTTNKQQCSGGECLRRSRKGGRKPSLNHKDNFTLTMLPRICPSSTSWYWENGRMRICPYGKTTAREHQLVLYVYHEWCGFWQCLFQLCLLRKTTCLLAWLFRKAVTDAREVSRNNWALDLLVRYNSQSAKPQTRRAKNKRKKRASNANKRWCTTWFYGASQHRRLPRPTRSDSHHTPLSTWCRR